VHDSTWAVVPLKSPDAAKSRLRGAVEAGARRHLVLAMAQHVVRTLVRAPGIAGVAVVTASAEIATHVEREGALVIWQDHDDGTAQACRKAAESLSRTADSLLMVSGDLPLMHVAAVEELIDLRHQAPIVAIAPDRRREGTNALLCAPPQVIAPCFGPGSFARHIAAAHARGLEARVVESDALSLDIDDLEDLDELNRRLDRDPSLLPAELRNALPRIERVPP
jgi:2-phospho-L-lactate/phosphoenolpyruvate guanylyltransferase